MGEEDIRRQQLNVLQHADCWGPKCGPVTSGSRTLRDAINEAMRDWMSSVETTHYILGSVVGPHPFPRDRSRLSIGHRPRNDRAIAPPARPAARPGRGLRRRRQQRGRHVLSVRRADTDVELVGVEAGGRSDKPGDHASPLSFGQPGVLHGSYSYVMQDEDGQTCDVHCDLGRARLSGRRPRAQLLERDRPRALHRLPRRRGPGRLSTRLARTEGILPALESSHAVAKAMELARSRPKDQAIVVCLSGRGDKDAAEIARLMAQRSNQ